MLKIFEAEWGNLFFDFSIRDLDVLPRISLSEVQNFGTIIQIGFLSFALYLTIFTENVRRLNREEQRKRTHESV